MINLIKKKQTRIPWNKGKKDENKYKIITCLCGKQFKSYISMNRKYCCQDLEKDKQRECELKEAGWNLIHIRGKR